MAKITFSSDAVAQLSNIQQYISTQLYSPIAAGNTVAGIFDALERLERFPFSGQLLSSMHPQTPKHFSQTRFLVFGKYIAVYDYNATEDSIEVLRIYHASQDYVRYLFD